MRRMGTHRPLAASAVGCAAVMIGLLLAAAPQAQAAAPQWKLTVTPNADYLFSDGGPHLGAYQIEAENDGNKPTSGAITVQNTLPAALNPVAVRFYEGVGGRNAPTVDLHESDCPGFSECSYGAAVKPGEKLIMQVLVSVPQGLEGTLLDKAVVSGGAPSAEATGANAASPAPPFGLLGFAPGLAGSTSSSQYTQAGGRPPRFSVEFGFETYSSLLRADTEGKQSFAGRAPLGDPRDVIAELPPGLLANGQAVPTCELADYFTAACSRQRSVVGDIFVRAGEETDGGFIEPVYNLQPQGEFPSELGATATGLPFILITATLRTGSDYGGIATSQALEDGVNRFRLNLWGVPADESHDPLRGKQCQYEFHFYASIDQLEAECEGDLQGGQPRPAEAPPAPFLVMPTECSGKPLSFTARYDTWQEPAEYAVRGAELEPVNGCGALAGLFAPQIESHPTTDLADAPSGLEFDLHLPQHEACTEAPSVSCEPATPSLKEAVVKLPNGLTVNPSSANGLAGCSPEAIGLSTPVGQAPAHFTEVPAGCPEQSAIGTAEVKTPLLHNPLQGIVYLATPEQNPFRSLLAAYIVLEGEGLVIKLPGQIEADPATGQLTGRFLENPQTPFEDFHLDFFGGARGDLRTPAVCGPYETTSVLTPYSAPESGPPAEPTSRFETTNGGSACPHSSAQQPDAPVFRAGTESPQAGAFSPFSLRLAREDGSQEISKIETTLPAGLTGKLAGVGECSDAQIAVAQGREHEGGGAEEQASPACPSTSEVGIVQVASGAGPTPLYVTGKAYLAGPYKGAPLSLAIITPAVAGPFDLGDVVVRTALYVDPFTAQIRAVSDPIPHILQGIPLDVRSITLKMSRPNFALNPTNCEEMHFEGAATSLLGNIAPLAQRFQVGGCGVLPFKPKLSLRLKGSPKRSKFPSLTATLKMPPGNANVAAAQVTLPHSSFLAQAHIAKTCGRPELAAHSCPAASVYGHATAVTPLLDHPLEGPVYLATGFGYQLPALVADLNGQIEVLLKGKVDSGRGDGIRNTFEVVPDAPVSRFTLHMFGGKRSLIENSEYLCGKHAKRKALARFTGQNGKIVELEPTVANSCKKKHRKHGRGHGTSGGSHGRALAALLSSVGW